MTTAAPGDLELVRAFVNTLDVEAGTDRLADLAAWRRWADAHDVAAEPSRPEDLSGLVELREAVRQGLLANHERRPLPRGLTTALDDAICWAGVGVTFTPAGTQLVSTSTGARGLAGQLVVRVAAALSDGTWNRLKACANDECRWAFYDGSRSRTGQWCSMEICGNRAKQSRWRSRQ